MQGKFDVGLDVGSVSVNLVIINPEGEVVKEVYRRHIGAPSRTALNLLESLEFPLDAVPAGGLHRHGGPAPGGDLRRPVHQ